MRNSYLIYPLLLLLSKSPSQTIDWSINLNSPVKPQGMICDKSGNVYVYGGDRNAYWLGNVYQDAPTETKGSFISKYSPSGSLLLTKQWDSPLFIHQMIYDGSNNFYFTGSFSGNVSIYGVSVSSRGQYDGVLGKMNEQGEVIWLTSFGGPKNDLGNSLTFDAKKQSLVVTGGVSDTFFVNDKLITVAPQRSTLLANFSLNGELTDHRLFDVLPTKNFNNCGYEIVTAASGNYFLLAEQEGRSYDNDNTVAPPEGKYIYKVDPSFTILWSKFIINNECYYGYQCAKMSTGNDDVYVPKFCSAKYGGQGTMMRLNDADGNATWTLDNKDGTYNDTWSDGNNVFFIGTEGASICPCPDNNFGHQVVKKLDAANNEELLITLANCRLTNITCNNQGMTFVAGNTYESLQIGNHQVQEGNFLFAIVKDVAVTTGVDEQAAEVFNLFPNPSEGIVVIRLSEEQTGENIHIRVTSLLGQDVYNEIVQTNQRGQYIIQLGDRIKGSYLVEVTSGDLKRVRYLILR